MSAHPHQVSYHGPIGAVGITFCEAGQRFVLLMGAKSMGRYKKKNRSRVQRSRLRGPCTRYHVS